MKLGSLFTGYGGLDMAANVALGTDTAWVCDNDPASVTLLAHHWPDVPNLGDITAVGWSAVEPVDVLAGGFPCQDISAAGKRAGMQPGNRSGLWAHMARAIEVLRPAVVVAENVRNLLNAPAHSDVEPCPWCLGDAPDGGMRALGAVLADLADLGYDAAWCGLRAADVGACHGRYRVFVVAQDSDRTTGGEWRIAAPGQAPGRRSRADIGGPGGEPVSLLPTPTAQAAKHGADDRGPGSLDDGNLWSVAGRLGGLLPTPMDSMQGASQREIAAGNPNCRLETAIALLPTPRATDGVNGGPNQRGTSGDLMLPSAVQPAVWGDYAPAIARHEAVFGRLAPAPTVRGSRGGNVLNPALCEWMMGLPEGHITAVPGLTRNQQLKLAGNGVVPQQAEAAIRHLLPLLEVS